MVTIADLLRSGVIRAHKDGNHGSNYPRAAEFGDKGIPFLTAKLLDDGHIDIDNAPRLPDERADSLRIGFVQPGDVLLSHNATIGRVAVVPMYTGRLLIGTSLTYFRLDKARLIPNYLAAFFRGAYFQNQLKAFMSHSTRNQVPITAQRHLQIVVPPVEEQLAITSILDALSDRIDLLRQTNTTLEAIAQALFKSWFVDFDPVHAKAEGHEPEAMDAATAALFPSEFEESELGAIPKGWRIGTLTDLADLNASKWTARKHPETVAYIDLSGVTSNRIDSAAEYLFEAAPSRARHHLRDGDTIVGTVRPGNRAFAYIHSPEPNLTGSTGFAVLSPKLAFYASYVYLAATGDESIGRLANLADGAAYPAVRPGFVTGASCVIGTDDIIRAFSAVTQPMLERIGEARRTIATLTNLRDTLLPRLISGKLHLPEASEATEIALA